MRLLSGATTALALAALAFIGWGAQLLPFPACGIRAGPCEVAGGWYSARLSDRPSTDRPPAVLFLHGSHGSGESFLRSPLSDKILREGWAIIAPTGLDMTYRSGVGSGWNVRNSPGPNRDEAAFLGAVLTDAVKQLKIDRDRVMVIGHSNGAFLTWDIACTRPDLARAYAAISGTFFGQPPERCAGSVSPVNFRMAF